MSLVLQVNGSGAWKNVCHLEADEVLPATEAVAALAKVLGPRPTWRIAAAVTGYPPMVKMDDAEIRAALVEPKSPAQIVSDCKAAVLRIGLGLCSLPEAEFLRELEKLYTEGFQAGVTAANQVAK